MLTIKGVSITFNKGLATERKALNKINLTLQDGDFVSVIGSNGAGKSTLLNCISGTYAIDEGSISLNHKEIQNMKEYKRAKHIGRLFQDPLKGTAPSMSIQENLELAYRRGSQNRNFFQKYLKTTISKEDTKLFKEKLQLLQLGLEDRMQNKVGSLSGGQRQGLTLLMATIIPPELLLLDEHTAALDPKTATQVMNITEDIIQEHNITTLMITHNIKHALEYGNRLIVMNEGSILFDFNQEEKSKLSVEDIMRLYAQASEKSFSDSMILMD